MEYYIACTLPVKTEKKKNNDNTVLKLLAHASTCSTDLLGVTIIDL